MELNNQYFTFLWILLISWFVGITIGKPKDQYQTPWYIGCYVPLSNQEQTYQKMPAMQPLTPASCSKSCRAQQYKYAFLIQTNCYCDDNLHAMTSVTESDCSIRCQRNPRNRCGGPGAYSVFSTTGPFISNVAINIHPSKAVELQTVKIQVKVTLAAEPSYPTGLHRFRNASFDTVDVALSVGRESLKYTRTIDIDGVQGALEVQHVYKYAGLNVIDVRVENALSSEDFRNYLQIISPTPEGLTVSDVSFHEITPPCTPNHITAPSGLNIEALESTSVFVGESVTLRAILIQGVNATFWWNVCGKRITSRPHLSTCTYPVCQSDRQTYQFNKAGLCNVTVRAANSYGRDKATLSVLVIAPEVRDLSVRVEDCDEACPFFSPSWFTTQLGPPSPRQSSPDFPIPPWIFDNDETTPAPPPTTTSPAPKLPPGTFIVGTKVCFRAIAYVSIKVKVQANVRFGDGKSIKQELLGAPSQFLSQPRFKRRALRPIRLRPTVNPYDHDPIPDMRERSAFRPIGALRTPNNNNNIQICYDGGCMMKFYFSHVYDRVGRFNIDVQITNSSHQIAARLEKSIRIVGEGGIITQDLYCDKIVSTGQSTNFSLEDGAGRILSWRINRRKSVTKTRKFKGRPLALDWQHQDTITSTSPLRHTFSKKGVYQIRVNDTGAFDANSAYCTMTVMDPISAVDLSLRPDIRFVSTADTVFADLRIGKGSKFNVTWYISNETFSDGETRNAPYETTYRFIPSFVGCQNLTVVIANNVSRFELSGSKPICSEERIDGLQLIVPHFLEVGEPASVIVTIERGSHVSLQVDVACNVGVHLDTLYQHIGATTGRSVFNFTTPPFPEPGSIRVVARARNHVTVRRTKRGPVELRQRRDIVVGKVIENFTVVVTPSESGHVAANNEDNVLITRIKGVPDKTGGILYKWSYPNDTAQRRIAILYTSSPIVTLRPRCNHSLYSNTSCCSLTVTATSGISNATALVNVTLEESRKSLYKPSIRHSLTVGWRDKFQLEVDCPANKTNVSRCRVTFSDSANSYVGFRKNTTTTIGHAFTSPGLWEISKEEFSSGGLKTASTISYVSIQEKLTRLKIKGDTVLVLDETPSGSWRAITGRGSHLVFQWKVKQHGTNDYLITSTRVTCVRMFVYHFKQWGLYDVIVDVFNDVSHMQISTTVEVRHAATHFDVTTTPTYLGRNSLFILSVNLTLPFTLHVTWMKDNVTESYTQDQLNVIGHGLGSRNITKYALHHLYPKEGHHQFLFMLEWEASDDVITQEFTGYSDVFDLEKNPAVVLKLRRNNESDFLNLPYHVNVDDVIKVEVKLHKLVTSLSWSVENKNGIVKHIVNATNTFNFQFLASVSGYHVCNVTSYPGGIGAVVRVFAFTPVTRLVLERPQSTEIDRNVNYCELKETDTLGEQRCSARFSVKSNGDRILFRFKFHRLSQNESTTGDIVTVDADNTKLSENEFTSSAIIEHTFTVEGAYNISVCAFANDHEYGNRSHLVPLMETTLDGLFYAETLPKVSLPQRNFFSEAGNVTVFKLKKYIPNQMLKANWDMGDGTYYNDGGMMIEHNYSRGGDYFMRITIYNHVNTTYLYPVVKVQERITVASISIGQGTTQLATGSPVTFIAATLPPDVGTMFSWYLSNEGSPEVTYEPTVKFVYRDAGTYLAKVIVKNRINEVESFPETLELIEPVTLVRIIAPRVVEIGQEVKLQAVYRGGSSARIEWNLGDGTIVLDELRVAHTYRSIKVYSVTLTVGNSHNSISYARKIYIMKTYCPFPSLDIPGIGSSEHYRSKPLRFEAILKFNCTQVESVAYEWTVKPVLHSEITSFSGRNQFLEIPPRELSPERYRVSVKASLIGTVLYVTDFTNITIVESKLIAKISGEYVRNIVRSSLVVINASESYDPDQPNFRSLKYTWECFVLHSLDKSCFKNHSLPTIQTPPPRTSTSPSGLRELPRTLEVQRKQNSYSSFPSSIEQGNSTLQFPASLLTDEANIFIFKIKISKYSRPETAAFASVVIKLSSQYTTALDLSRDTGTSSMQCPVCDLSSMIRHKGALLSASCDNCVDENMTYDWSISAVDDDSRSFLKDEMSDCSPPDGSGWATSWSHNTSHSLAGFNQSEVLEHDKNYLEVQNRNRTVNGTLDFPLHPDDANFTGVLLDEDIADPNEALFPGQLDPKSHSPYQTTPIINAGGLVPMPQFEETNLPRVDEKQEEEYFATADDHGFDPPLNNTENVATKLEENSDLPRWPDVLEGGFENIPSIGTITTTKPRIVSNLKDGDPPASFSHLPEGETGSRVLDGGARRNDNNRQLQAPWALLPSQNPYNPIFQDGEGSYQNSAQFHSGSVGPLPEEHPIGGRFTDRRKPNFIDETPSNSPSNNEIFDTAIDDSAPMSSIGVDHFQDLPHTRIPLNEVASIKDYGKGLYIKPNSLTEGKTYAISVDVSFDSALGSNYRIKRGKAVYYMRVVRGPSYGECSIVSIDSNTKFRIHCFQWRNMQSNKLDTFTSLNEMLYYEVSYSLSESGLKRPLYFGSSHEREVDLPASFHPVYIYVQIYNSLGAATEVCAFPVNVTRPERKLGQSAQEDFNYVYYRSVGRYSQLHHILLTSDQNAVLGFVNVLLDSLPSESDLTFLVAQDVRVGKRMREISTHLSKALLSLSSKRLSRKADILMTVSRFLKFYMYFGIEAISATTETVIQNLGYKDRSAFSSEKESLYGIEFATENPSHQKRDGVIENVLICLEKLSASLHSITSMEMSERLNQNVLKSVEELSRLEIDLRDFILDTSKQQGLNSTLFSSNNIFLMSQRANSSLSIDLEQSVVGAIVPENVYSKYNYTTYLSSIAYLKESPYISTKNFEIQMDKTALSLWLTDSKNNEIHTRNLDSPITIQLPPRRQEFKELRKFPYMVTRERMSIHEFNVTLHQNSTLHVEVTVDTAINRPFTVAVVFSSRKLPEVSPFNDSSIIESGIFPSKRRSNRHCRDFKKFTFAPKSLMYGGTYYVTLWNIDEMTAEQRRRYAQQNISYAINVWWSDCYYWNRVEEQWSRDGCYALKDSTVQQTICSTSHLSTFSSSFQKVATVFLLRDLAMFATVNALKYCAVTLSVVFLVFAILIAINDRVLRRHSRVGKDEEDLQSEGLGDFLRWLFGTDDRGQDCLVPVILIDNKSGHNQVFEITMQTGNWPGSGTTSQAYIILFGVNGKYEARELKSPSGNEMGYHCSSEKRTGKKCCFETGSTKTFIATFEKNLGPLWKICVWHNHTGPHPRWYLDHVIVRDVNSGEKWFFPCSSWLSLDSDLKRVSVALTPLERKPHLIRHLALRARNYMFDLHSILPIIACARWSLLNRFQRIVHCLTLCVLILALSTGKHYTYATIDFWKEFAYFSAESLAWGFGIGALATIILVPPQLILRYTRRDERISISIEDDTCATEDLSLSRLGFDNRFKEEPPSYVAPGGLSRKTAATSLDLEALEEVTSHNSLPTSKNLVSEWLRLKGCDSDSIENLRDLDHPYIPQEVLQSWSELPRSASSCDSEIARCMTPSSAVANCDTSGRALLESYSVDSSLYLRNDYNDSYLSNSSHSRQPLDDVLQIPSFGSPKQWDNCNSEKYDQLAMDGPVLVPCEKLDSDFQKKSAPLPRTCAYVAHAYYLLVLIASCIVIIYGALYALEDIDVNAWIETVFFAVFWTVVFIEVMTVAFFTLISTARNLWGNTNLTETLNELFPAVDAAYVDDYVYKSPETLNEPSSSRCEDLKNVLDPTEIYILVSERRRSRYLRNMFPPYNKKGKWKNIDDPLRIKARELRRSSTAKRAASSWLGLGFLVLLVTGITTLLMLGSSERQSQGDHIRLWLSNGFVVDEDLVVRVKAKTHQKSVPPLNEIKDFSAWKTWFNSNFIQSSDSFPNYPESSNKQSNRNNVMLGFVKVTVFNHKRRNYCKVLPYNMRMILKTMKHCVAENEDHPTVITTASSHQLKAVQTFHIDLTKRNKSIVSNLLNPRKIEGIQIEFVSYNKVTKKYSIAKALSHFSSPFQKTKILIRSASLHYNNLNARKNLLHYHVILIIWVACVGIRLIMRLIEQDCKSSAMKAEIKKRSINKMTTLSFLVDLLIWLTVIAYLISSTFMRANAFSAVDILEKSGHLHNDSGSIIENVLNNETAIRYILSLWSILLVMKGLSISVNYHGLRSHLTNGIVATYLSVKNVLLAIIIPLILFIFGFALLGYLFLNTSDRRHSTFMQSMQNTAFSSIWLGFIGGCHKNNFSIQKERESIFRCFYIFVGFFITRIVLKAFVVASHQWYYNKSKLSQLCRFHGYRKCSPKKSEKREKNKTSVQTVKTNKEKDEKYFHRAHKEKSSRAFLQWHSKYRYVTFKEVLLVYAEKITYFAKLLSLCCCNRHVLRWLKPEHSGEESSLVWTSRHSLPRTLSQEKEYSFTSYDKSKLPDESGYSTCGMSDVCLMKGQKRDTTQDRIEDLSNYKLTGNVALSEVELQVEEFASKATALIDDVMNTFFWLNNTAKKSKSLRHDDDNQTVKIITDELVKLITHRQQSHHDDATAITSSPSSSLCSTPTSTMGRQDEAHVHAQLEGSSCSVTTSKDFSDVFDYLDNEKLSDVAFQHKKNENYTSPVPSDSGQLKNVKKTGKVPGGKVYPKREVFPSSLKAINFDSSGGSDSSSNLTTDNIALHNRQISRKSSDPPCSSCTPSGEKRTTLESTSSNTSFSKTSLEETNGSGRTSSIFKSLLSLKRNNKRTKAKSPVPRPRGLRRSQTIFIDVRDLPVITSSTSPIASRQSRKKTSCTSTKSSSTQSSIPEECSNSGHERSKISFTNHGYLSDYSANAGQCEIEEAHSSRNLPGCVEEEEEVYSAKEVLVCQADAAPANTEFSDNNDSDNCGHSVNSRSLSPCKPRSCFINCPPTIVENVSEYSRSGHIDYANSVNEGSDIMEELRENKRRLKRTSNLNYYR